MIEALAGGPHGISMQLDVVRPSLEGSAGCSIGSLTILPLNVPEANYQQSRHAYSSELLQFETYFGVLKLYT